MDQLKLKRYSSEILIEECILGNGIMVVSQFFWDNTLRVFSKEFLQDLYCFPLLRKNEMIYMPEYIKWSSDLNSRESGKFTAPFIRIIESVFLQNQVQGIN